MKLYYKKPSSGAAGDAAAPGSGDGQNAAPLSAPPKKPAGLGDALVASGTITAEQLEQALAEQKGTDRKLGRVLVDLGFCTQEQVTQALQEQIRRIRIGDLLVDLGYISEGELQSALKTQKESGKRIGQVLIDQGLVTERQIGEAMAEQLQIPYVDLTRYQYHPEVAKSVKETLARRFRALPLSEGSDGVLVGMADPTDIFVYDELRRILNKPIQLAIVAEKDLIDTIDRIYRRTEEINRVVEELGEEVSRSDFDLNQLVQAEMKVDAPVVRLLQTLFEEAVQSGASDIHIEPDEKVLRVRMRIDGVLHEQEYRQRHITGPLVSRLKLMSGLDIAEKRLPQDGRFNIRVLGRSVDVRVSTLPLAEGESVVMRLLDQSGGILSLDDLGMPDPIKTALRRLLHHPHGLILVTGPTGSGKTTTLYSALSEINHPEKKIITVEDPVEYRLPRICQVQVRANIGLDFPRVLRTALRQDPDIVLVGEMRDRETAEIGVRGALTGHLVLSTLHTNDAVSTPIRLLDMGLEGYLLASGLLGVMAQRLVRRICRDCAEPDTPDPRLVAAAHALHDGPDEAANWRRGAGCNSCNNTGYRGRLGVYELLEIDGPMAEALRSNDHAAFQHAAVYSDGFRAMEQVAVDYARQGLTTLDEALRLAGQSTFLEEPDDDLAPAAPETDGNTEPPVTPDADGNTEPPAAPTRAGSGPDKPELPPLDFATADSGGR